MLWLTTQTLCGYTILATFYFLFEHYNTPINLLYLTVLAVTIGDGLAEPIGITFGKRQYHAKSFFDKRLYFRTMEGSFTVYLTSLILCIFFISFFNSFYHAVNYISSVINFGGG